MLKNSWKTMFFLLLLSLPLSFLFSQNETIDSLENLLSEEHYGKNRIEIYTLLSRQYQLVDIEKSREYANQAMILSKTTGSEEYLGEIYGCLGDIAVITDSLELARQHYLHSLELFEQYGRNQDLAGVTMVLGNIANVQNNLAEAMIYYQRAIGYAEKAGLDTWLDDLHLNIGLLNIKAGKPDVAQSYFTKALELSQETGDSLNIANAFGNIGLTYMEYNDLELAGEYMDKARAIYAKKRMQMQLSQALLDAAMLEYRKGNHNIAMKLLDSSMVMLEVTEVTYSPRITLVAVMNLEKGKNLMVLGKPDSAKGFYKEAFLLGKRSRQLEVVADAANGLADYWASKRRFDSAYFYQKVFKAYSDTLIREKNLRELAYQDARFKYEQELALEKREREKQQAQEKRRILWLSIIIGGLILMLVILALLLKLGRNKVKRIELEQENLKKELEVRNKELNTHVIYQLRKNEFILDISKKLQHLVSNLKTENRKAVQDVIRQLDSDTTDEVWKEFEVRFQRVHTGFYKALTIDFPDLTTNELRLCAFLRLNMNTKDIAAITYQSTNSIDVARSRLRQKFGISKEENLSAFLARY